MTKKVSTTKGDQSVKTEVRQRINNVKGTLLQVSERPNAEFARRIAATLNNVADWFEGHPHRWTQGRFAIGNGEQRSYCNLGLLQSRRRGIKDAVTTDMVSRAAGSLVALNDRATSLEENVYGLRLIAAAWDNYAARLDAGIPADTAALNAAFKAAVKAAFAKNSHLLQVQSARRDAKRFPRRQSLAQLGRTQCVPA